MLRGSLVLITITCACGLSTPPTSSDVASLGGGVGTIEIDPPIINLSGPAGVVVTRAYSIEGTAPSTQLVGMEWVTPDPMALFSSQVPPCDPGLACSIPSLTLPTPGVVECTPPMFGTRTAALKVTSNTGAVFTAMVTCGIAVGGPSFMVPESVGPIIGSIGASTPAVLVVTNNGGEELMITVSLGGANAAHWRADECTTNPCPLAVGGTVTVDLAFEPTEHGDLDATIDVFGPPAIGSQTVELLGTGLGGKLRVDEPASPFVLDFGTIAKNQVVNLPVQLSNIGNATLDVTPSDPAAPFTVAVTPITIADGNQGQFDVTCSSPDPMTVQTGTVTLTTDAYAQNTPSIEVRCAIADTTIQVTNPLDFGELRVGDPAGMLEVTIANPPGGATVDIQRIALVAESTIGALTLVPPDVPSSLAGGDELVAMLVLATTEDVELDGVRLEVDVIEGGSSVTLAQPVSGKVGTPAAVVLPAQLDLGTVCIGTPVEGEIAMSNTGTATLAIQRPTMTSQTFVPLFTNPTDYPADGAPLLPGDKATVGVMLATDAPGLQEDVLRWEVDAPGSPFETRIGVELLMDGTAVTPGGLRFNSIEITEPPTMTQTITLENCGPDPALVSYDRVVASEGDAAAWKLDPPAQQRELLPDETMRVRVAFDPRRPGLHRSVLPFAIGDGEQTVDLEGEATGNLPDPTSFYACGCGGSSPGGWPIMLVVPLVLRRRRTC